MRKILDITLLPKSIAKRPDVRAASMMVIKHPQRNEFLVQAPGHAAHVVVQYGSDSLSCDCTAAGYGRQCAHVIAVEARLKEA